MSSIPLSDLTLEKKEEQVQLKNESSSAKLNKNYDDNPLHSVHSPCYDDPCAYLTSMGSRVVAHLRFTVRWNYLLLFYAAIAGRMMKIIGTIFGAALVTPLYKCFVDPTYPRMNVMYDKLSPFLRRWFIRLSNQNYNLVNIVDMIANERRGAVISEFVFTVIQAALFKFPAYLLPLTVVGVFLNAVPRQFYAQLKLLIRNLHISYIDRTMEKMVAIVPKEKKLEAKYDGKKVFDADGVKEQPSQYLVFRGKHHTGCWRLILTEAIDFFFSFVGGVLMIYLLIFSVVLLLHVFDVSDRDRMDKYFPFLVVTLARFAKSMCNFITTENLINSAEARQSQHEIYFLQRMSVMSRLYPDPSDFIKEVYKNESICPRSHFEFIGRPCLEHEEESNFQIPVMDMYSFLDPAQMPVSRYQNIIDDGVCGSHERLLTRTEEGSYPSPFDNQPQLDKLRSYAGSLMWEVFSVERHPCGDAELAMAASKADNTDHRASIAGNQHSVDCNHHGNGKA